MKRILQISAFAVLLMVGTSWRNNASAQVDMDISYQTFYDELSPYGEWVDYPDYGYVWVPSESTGFRPYETNGHWVWTDEYEWMWASDYDWGWAPFHYGRWFDDPSYGWMWVPGYEWSPAWVAWRDGGDYYGWAPLRPGINISIGFSMGSYNPPVDYWSFAPRQYISSPRIYDYCLDRSRNVTIINNTTIINNYSRRNNVFMTGPRRADAERYAGRINPVRFRDSNRPGRTQFRNNEVSIYRPRVQQSDTRRFTPRNFERYDRNRSQNNGFAGRDRNVGARQQNSNNLPDRRQDDRFERNNNAQQQQQSDNRRFDRNNGFDRGNDGRVERQQQQAERQQQMQQRQQTERQQQDQSRRFERQQQPQVERQQQMQQRQQVERQQQDQSRRFERQQQPQVERQQQSQPQQVDRGNGGNREQRNGNDNGGRGHGRRF